ncbi:MAG TPA: response regulator transcription factor [Bacteroidia bacterium]|jgi:two-component system invasion response regulator UvrY|nr:response regulator transcription factor [Bacteroidia bacterium]
METLIADSHELIREGFKKIILEKFPSAIVDEASDGKEAEKEGRNNELDLIIMEMDMPKKSGLDVLKALRLENIQTPILMFSINPKDQSAIRVLKAGGNGYISTETSTVIIKSAIKTILSGRKYISPELAEQLANRFDNYNDEGIEIISDRELQVLKFIGSGKTVSEIAKELSLSVSTISTYSQRLLEKIGMKNNSELMQYAITSLLI